MEWVRPITKSWLSTIRKAWKIKKEEFQDDADECMRFFDGPHDFMYAGEYAAKHGGWSDDQALPSPTFRMTYNKVAEAVQLYGPALYHRNPHRQVNPASLPEIPIEYFGDPQDPLVAFQIQQFQQSQQAKSSRAGITSTLMEFLLNYTPNELDLRGHSRKAIDESIIKGCGLLWPEVYTPPGGTMKMVGSFYDTVDHLVVDPDMEDMLYAKWIARKRVLPKHEVERRYGLKPGTLRGNLESLNRQGQSDGGEDYQYHKKRGDTADLFCYWEVYSRMGLGHYLMDYGNRRVETMAKVLDNLGQYCFLAVSEDYPYPLNIPKEVAEKGSQREIFHRVQWPTPYWADPTNPWPFVHIAYHNRPRKVWPMSHIKPGLGEIRFLNWAFSFIADKIKNTSRDFIALISDAADEMRRDIRSGKDLTVLNVKSPNRNINEVVSFLQHPEFNKDIWATIEAMMMLLERRIGLNELMYGESSRQLRSAQEAQVKGDQLRIRPDDMAECVETAMTLLARKEAIASYWHLDGRDVAPVMGPDRAYLWDSVVKQAQLPTVVTELAYRIEAGSIRKPNRSRDQANANQAVAQWGQVAFAHAQGTGDFGPINRIARMWSKAHDMEEEAIVFQPPPPQPNPEEMKLQLEQQKMQADLEMKQAEFELKSQEKQQELVFDQDEHEQEMEQDRETHLLKMLQMRQEGDLKLDLAEQQADAKVDAMKAQAAAKPSTNGNGSE